MGDRVFVLTGSSMPGGILKINFQAYTKIPDYQKFEPM
jgi:hypothetical protein